MSLRDAATATLALGLIAGAQPASGAPQRSSSRPTAAQVDALRGAMPSSYDVYPEDPCSGEWDLWLGGGQIVMKLTIYRWRGLPLVNRQGLNLPAANQTYTRTDPYGLTFGFAGRSKVIMRCVRDRATGNLFLFDGTGPLRIEPRRPPAAVAPRATSTSTTVNPASAAPTTAAAAAALSSVREDRGNISYVDAAGRRHQITDEGHYSDPVLSPDGRTIAFIHLDGQPTSEGDPGFTSLWLADTTTLKVKRLMPSRPDEKPERNLAAFYSPRFSLDGGFVYVNADAWATSSAVHQINVATGAERFVVDGHTAAVIRTGPYRGHLIVGQHRYRKAPASGSFNPLYVVRPDGTEVMMVPGSDADDYDADALQAAWLRARGWQAW